MSNKNELVEAMNLLEAEKGISKEVIKEALETALVLAYKKNYDQAANVEVEFNELSGTITVYAVKTVVEEVEDPLQEISLSDALKINRAYEVGDMIRFPVKPKGFGRIATQTAKHVIMQRIREAERDIIYDEFIDYKDEILTGTVERQDHRFVYVNLGRSEAVMPTREQIPTEHFELDQRIKVYVLDVDKNNRGSQITVSRAHPDFLKRLFEQEVPEIYDGVVEIMSVAREAGDRSKIAVRSRDANVDPVGTCVGQGGSRVQSIVAELNGENMDIIEYDEDPAVFIKNAMSPATVDEVVFNEEEHACIVVVPEDQLSLAIGKRGQNARLAARLTTYKIDIKSHEAYEDYLEEENARLAELAQQEEAAAEEVVSDSDLLEEESPVEVISEVELREEIAEDIAEDEFMEYDEENLTPDQMEEAVSEVEDDPEQDYEELVEEVEQSQTPEEL